MEDFMEVTLGELDMKANGRSVGYSDGSSIQAAIEYKPYDALTPKRRIGKVKTKISVNAGTSLKEIKPLNLLLAMGIKDSALKDLVGSTVNTFWKAITEWAATTAVVAGDVIEPTVLNGFCYTAGGSGDTGATEPTFPTTVGATVVDGDITWTCGLYPTEAHTTSKLSGGDLIEFQTDHCNIAVGNSPVLYNADHTAKYLLSDTLLDKKAGLFKVKPSGGIPNGVVVNVMYQYTELLQQRFDFNPDAFVLAYADIFMEHRKPTDGRKIRFESFKMQANATTMSFNPVDYTALDLKLNGFYDPDRGNYSYGRITWLD